MLHVQFLISYCLLSFQIHFIYLFAVHVNSILLCIIDSYSSSPFILPLIAVSPIIKVPD